MNEVETALLIYCIITALAGHVWLALRIQDRRKHYRRSKAAKKAAATRRANGTAGRGRQQQLSSDRSPWAGPPPAKKKPAPVVPLDQSAWLADDEEDEVEYNEMSAGEAWRPEVRRFNGTAKEYAARNDADGSVKE